MDLIIYDFILNPYWKVTLQGYIEACLNDLSYGFACGLGFLAVIALIFAALSGFVDLDKLNELGR